MTKEKMTPTPGATSKNPQAKLKSIPTKHELCLLELIKAGFKGIHKIGAPSEAYGETCLPTTISQLKRDYGFEFNKVRRKHHRKAGGYTYFTWYSLASFEQAIKALLLLAEMRCKRNHPDVTDINTLDHFLITPDCDTKN